MLADSYHVSVFIAVSLVNNKGVGRDCLIRRKECSHIHQHGGKLPVGAGIDAPPTERERDSNYVCRHSSAAALEAGNLEQEETERSRRTTDKG